MSASVSITSLYGYLDLLEGYPIDVIELLNECGVDYQQLLSQRGAIPSSRFNKLLHLTAERTQDPCFGLKLSERQSHNVLGLVGVLMEKSPDVRTAVLNGIHYANLQAQGIRVELQENGAQAMYTFEVIENPELAQTTVDLAIGHGCNIVRMLTGRRDAIDAVYLAHSNPMASADYRKFLGAPVSFNHEFNAIVYDRKLLDITLPGYNDLLYAELVSRVEGLQGELPQSITERVKVEIRDGLSKGRASIDSVADKLGLSRQQLQHRLMKENLNYKELLEEVRKSIARERLLYSDVSITNLAELLGYSDQTAFGRAFERWYGLRPRAWRNKFRIKKQ